MEALAAAGVAVARNPTEAGERDGRRRPQRSRRRGDRRPRLGRGHDPRGDPRRAHRRRRRRRGPTVPRRSRSPRTQASTAVLVDRAGHGGFAAAFDREGYTRRARRRARRRATSTSSAWRGSARSSPPSFFERFGGRVLNTHPSLLPAFRGWHAVRDALAAGATTTGCTVHLATDRARRRPDPAPGGRRGPRRRRRGPPARADQGGRAPALPRGDRPRARGARPRRGTRDARRDPPRWAAGEGAAQRVGQARARRARARASPRSASSSSRRAGPPPRSRGGHRRTVTVEELTGLARDALGAGEDAAPRAPRRDPRGPRRRSARGGPRAHGDRAHRPRRLQPVPVPHRPVDRAHRRRRSDDGPGRGEEPRPRRRRGRPRRTTTRSSPSFASTGALCDETRARLARTAFAHTAAYDAAIVAWFDADVTTSDGLARDPAPHLGARSRPSATGRTRTSAGRATGSRARRSCWDDRPPARRRRAQLPQPLRRRRRLAARPRARRGRRGARRGHRQARQRLRRRGGADGRRRLRPRPRRRRAQRVRRRRSRSPARSTSRSPSVIAAGPQADVVIARGLTDGARELLVARRKATRLLTRRRAGPRRALAAHDRRRRARPGSRRLRAAPVELDGRDLARTHRRRAPPTSSSPGACAGARRPTRSCSRATAPRWASARASSPASPRPSSPSRKAGERAKGAAAASDAFFPFPDGLEVLAAAGRDRVVQPGGSIKDDDDRGGGRRRGPRDAPDRRAALPALMAAILLDGERLAQPDEGRAHGARRQRSAAEGRTVGLGTILVGDDVPSARYVALEARGLRRGRHRVAPRPPPRRRAAGRRPRRGARVQRGPRRRRVLGPGPAPRRARRGAAAVRRRPRQGRRRAAPGEPRPAHARHARRAALHAGGHRRAARGATRCPSRAATSS